jgi:hypothetical protein
MKGLVATAGGIFLVDLDEEEVEASTEELPPLPAPPDLGLPRVIAAARSGSTIVVAVDSRPPMVVSHDGGRTWRESGRGLPTGRAVSVAEDDPDLMLFAARNRLYLSRDGGRFWKVLAVELPEIDRVELRG